MPRSPWNRAVFLATIPLLLALSASSGPGPDVAVAHRLDTQRLSAEATETADVAVDRLRRATTYGMSGVAVSGTVGVTKGSDISAVENEAPTGEDETWLGWPWWQILLAYLVCPVLLSLSCAGLIYFASGRRAAAASFVGTVVTLLGTYEFLRAFGQSLSGASSIVVLVGGLGVAAGIIALFER